MANPPRWRGISREALAGHLIDPLGGLADLRAHRLRLANPRALEHDPGRVLRAARFIAGLGMTPTPETQAAARQTAPEIEQLHPGRIHEELNALFAPTGARNRCTMASSGRRIGASGGASPDLRENRCSRKRARRAGARPGAGGAVASRGASAIGDPRSPGGAARRARLVCAATPGGLSGVSSRSPGVLLALALTAGCDRETAQGRSNTHPVAARARARRGDSRDPSAAVIATGRGGGGCSQRIAVVSPDSGVYSARQRATRNWGVDALEVAAAISRGGSGRRNRAAGPDAEG